MASPYALDFSPVANALDGNRKYGLQLQDQEMDRNRLAIAQAAAGREAQLFPYKKQQIEIELAQARDAAKQQQRQRALAFIEANLGEGGSYAKLAPDVKAKHWNSFLNSPLFDADDKKMLDDPVHGPLWRDPSVGYRMLYGMASKYRDPLEKRKIEAEIGKANRIEAKPGERVYDATNPTTPIVSVPEKSAPLIKDGDKPLVVFEPGPDGRLNARTVYDGPQGQAVTGIAGGMRELHDIPTRYGGDKGVFGSAVGAFQGDPNSMILGGLSRAWGSLSSYTASGPGSSAPPAEVRRAIEGATNTLAASLKPLIRKPGEGSWSDRDQAVLDSIVGNLTRANDVAQYDRELENVRSRIEQNFGVKLPALVRKAQTERAPTSQPNPEPVKRITTEAEYGALRSGTRYIAPDGSVRTKR